jgi:hypothetical protein
MSQMAHCNSSVKIISTTFPKMRTLASPQEMLLTSKSTSMQNPDSHLIEEVTQPLIISPSRTIRKLTLKSK